MLSALISFYLNLWYQYLLSGYYNQELIVDSEHPHYRRFTARYKKKKSLVKSIWIGVGLITLLFPLLHVVFSLTLLTTFVSFSILDETQ